MQPVSRWFTDSYQL